nr:hypothetical protein [Tanacetum cinerariifolium]
MLCDVLLQHELQGLLPIIVAQAGDHISNQGINGCRNDNTMDDSIHEDVRNVNVNNGQNGCSYKDFVACMPKEFDATEPPIIHSVILKGGVLTDEAVRNGSLKRNGEKRGENIKEGNVRGDNKKARTGKVFVIITTLLGKSTRVRHPNVQTAISTITSRRLVMCAQTSGGGSWGEWGVMRVAEKWGIRVYRGLAGKLGLGEQWLYSILKLKNGSLKRNGGESSKEGNVKGDNKRARTGMGVLTRTLWHACRRNLMVTGAVAYIRWVEKMEAVQDISGCGDNQKVKYSAGLLIGKALAWWNSKASPSLGYPRDQKGYKVRNGSLKRNGEKRGENIKEGNVRGDNKKARTGKVFVIITTLLGKSTRVRHPNVQTAISTITSRRLVMCAQTDLAKDCRAGPRMVNPLNVRNPTVARGGHGNNGNPARGRAFVMGAEEARQDLNIVTGTFSLNNHYATMLFDSGADYSFVSTTFMPLLDIKPNSLGVDWLSKHRGKIVFHERVVQISLRHGEMLRVYGEWPEEKVKHLMSAKAEEPKLEDITIIQNFFEEDHEMHLGLILDLLKEEKLYAKFSKCEFWWREVQFLRHVVNSDGIHVDPSKIEAIKNWEASKSPTEGDEQEMAFQTFKDKLYNAPVLALLDGPEEFMVYYDASCQGLGCMLMQRGKVIAYASRWLKIHEKNYTTHDLELVTMIAKSLPILTQKNKKYVWGDEQEMAFQTLKDKLCNAPILTLPDGPEDFVTELFSDHDCKIRYHPGKANVVADELSIKERNKPRRVRAMNMTIQSSIKSKIQAAQNEALGCQCTNRNSTRVRRTDKT